MTTESATPQEPVSARTGPVAYPPWTIGARPAAAADLIPGLFETVAARLRNGPASASTLARFCDLRLPFMQRMLDGYCRAHKLRRQVNLYALPPNPYSPAGRITIPQYRWGGTRLG